jgi:hypothetical protein
VIIGGDRASVFPKESKDWPAILLPDGVRSEIPVRDRIGEAKLKAGAPAAIVAGTKLKRRSRFAIFVACALEADISTAPTAFACPQWVPWVVTIVATHVSFMLCILRDLSLRLRILVVLRRFSLDL